MSVFEIIMLLCFGFAWPFSVYKSWKSGSNEGKSLIFLFIIFSGYVAGVLHKVFYNFDLVIWLYALDGILVGADILLYMRNARRTKRRDGSCV